jgi:hypothetical protein
MAFVPPEHSLGHLLRVRREQWRDRVLRLNRVHLLHIGKTAGTALMAALRDAPPSGTRILFHKHYFRLADVPIGEQCFFVVRDPVARFASGFFSRQRQGQPRYFTPWNDGEKEAFARFAKPNDLALALSSDDDELRRMAETAMGNIGHVRDHLHRWFRDEAYLRQRRQDILFVGSQERLAGDVAALSDLLDTSIDLPTDDVASHRNPAHLDRQLDEEAIVNLRIWYREDYALLRLMREWFPNLPDYDGTSPQPMTSRKAGQRSTAFQPTHTPA